MNKKKNKKYFIKEKFLFLRKLYLKKYSFLIKKNLVFNYFFYRSFLNYYKTKKQKYVYNLFFKNKHSLKPFFPEFSLSKNVFNNKLRFKTLSDKYKINYIFCSNKLNNSVFGLNYYFKNSESNKNNLISFVKDLDLDENKNLIQFKNFDIKDDYLIHDSINPYLNYNISIFCNLEIYKILIFLYINKVIIKYIYEDLNQKQIRIDLKTKLLVITLLIKNFQDCL